MRNDIFLKDIGNRLRVARKAKNISLRQLEKITDIDMANVSRIENGKINFHILTLKTLTEVFELDIKDFL